jgi:hypothetical protein
MMVDRPDVVVTLVDPPRILRDGGRSAPVAPACRVGRSISVLLLAVTLVGLHPGSSEAFADLPRIVRCLTIAPKARR